MKKDYVGFIGDDKIKVYFPVSDESIHFETYEEALRQELINRGILKPNANAD